MIALCMAGQRPHGGREFEQALQPGVDAFVQQLLATGTDGRAVDRRNRWNFAMVQRTRDTLDAVLVAVGIRIFKRNVPGPAGNGPPDPGWSKGVFGFGRAPAEQWQARHLA